MTGDRRSLSMHPRAQELDIHPCYGSGALPDGRPAIYQRAQNDCMRAAVASALAVEYEDTPEGRSDDLLFAPLLFWQDWNSWAEARDLIFCLHRDPQNPPTDREWWIGSTVGFDQLGKETAHALVMHHNALVHDPSPRATNEPPGLRRGITFDSQYVNGLRVRELIDDAKLRPQHFLDLIR